MLAMFKDAKEAVERISGCRIYRKTLPHGVDCYFDIERTALKRDGIKVVFDVGANIGQSALKYLNEFPKAEIFSFEPVANTFSELVTATSKFRRIHPYNFGMARESGEALINVNPTSRVSSIKLKRPDDHSETIRLETIAGFVEKHQLGTIDFLKIDTEGFDLEVLAGAAPLLRQHRVHFVQSECEPVVRTKDFVSFPVLAQFMADFGYRIFGVYEQQPEWDGKRMLLYWNAVFICEKLIPPGSRMS